MKKKILIFLALLTVVVCALAVSVSAEAPSMYIEFDVKLSGNTEYTTAYVENTSNGNPCVNLTFDFYSDKDFTTTIDKNEIVAMDFSQVVTYGDERGYVDRFTTASADVFPNCEEIKWFSRVFTTTPNSTFNGWTQLKRFDLGCAIIVDYNFLSNSGIEDIVIPASVTTLKDGVFSGCTSLKTVKIEGAITSIGSSEFSGCTALTTVDLGKITSIGDQMFYGCTSLKSIVLPSTVKAVYKNPFQGCTSLESADLGQITSMSFGAFSGCKALKNVIIPDTLVTMGDTNFENCISLKYAKIPNSVTSMGYGTFQGCSALEFAEISNATGKISTKTFYNCSSLKAIYIPEGITKINEYAFAGCTALKATYLPSTLATIGDNTGWGRGAFDSCKNLYFVQNSFSVKDENGNWLGDSFVMPSEPTVYYMPSSLTTIVGCEFKDCQQINRYVVFPTGVTQISAWEGAFSVTGTYNTKGAVTFVFLGDMDTFCYSARDNRYKNVSFIFANANDTSIASFTKFQLGYKALAVNSYAYFCAGNVVYDLSSFSPPHETYAVQETDFTKTVNTAETQPHFVDPKKTVSVGATCLTNQIDTTYCFCSALIDTNEVENTALGHNHDLENGATLLTITYADFTKNGYKEIKCSRCENVNTEVAVLPVIIFDGYSVDETTKSIFAIGFRIDKDAIDAYEEATGNTLTFGVIGVLTDNLTEKDENGNVVNTFKPLDAPSTVPVIKAAVPETVTAFNLKIRGFNTDEYRALDITMSAFVTVTDAESNENTVYIQDAQVESPSAYSVAQYIIDNTPGEVA